MISPSTVDSTALALQLLKLELTAKPGETILISPLSISCVLGMCANGAGGQTLVGITDVLGVKQDNESLNKGYSSLLALLKRADIGATVNIANGIFAKLGVVFDQKFIKVNDEFFNAELSTLDFADEATIATINSFVSRATNDKITELLKDPIAADTVLFIVNCLYFKGEWTQKFDKELTKQLPFAAASGTKDVAMMYRTARMVHGQDYENNAWQAISLPFGKAEEVRFIAFLPGENTTLEQMLAGLDVNTIRQFTASSYETQGELWLPRLTLVYDNKLQDSLAAMGMADAFSEGVADFSGICPALPAIFIKDIVHKTKFTVDELGAEGVAVTVAKFTRECAESPYAMRCDKPFAFFVTHASSGAVIFAGAVNDPCKSIS